MIFLFNQHWDIIPGKEEEYTNFAINHYIPTMKKIGINPVGGFYVVCGGRPRGHLSGNNGFVTKTPKCNGNRRV